MLLAALVVAVPATARAHGQLKSSVPAAGALLSAVPRELRLDFTEVPELAFTTLQLMNADGAALGLGAVRYASDSRRAVVVDVRAPLAAGRYRILWQMAGSDGHPMRGQIDFTIAEGAQGVAAVPLPGPVATAPPAAAHHVPTATETLGSFGAESWVYVAIRWVQYGALLIVIGAVAFRLLVLGFLRRKEDPDSPMLADAALRAARFGVLACGVLLLTLLLRLYAQSYALHGAARALDVGRIGVMIGDTIWGRGWLLQLAGVVLAWIGFRGVRRSRSITAARVAWGIAAVGAVALAFSPPFSGHAAAVPRFLPLAIAADGAHVLGAGGWLGSLLIVVIAGIPAALALPDGERGPMVAELVNAFSPTALMFAGLVAATGTFAAWLHLGSIPALWQSGYGKTLLVKLAVLSAVALTGAYNWLRVKPALGEIEGAHRIRRSGTVELVIGVIVLLVTAVLVATPTPMDMRG